MIQIAPQMRVLVAIEPVDGRKGMDSLARLCQEKLAEDPFSGCVFIFRSRRGTTVRVLTYDGQGFWLLTKRFSKGRFGWWPEGEGSAARQLEAWQAQLFLAAGDASQVRAAPGVALGEWQCGVKRTLIGTARKIGQIILAFRTDLSEPGSVTKPAAEVLEISREDLESLLERVRPSLPEEDFRKLKAVVEGLSYLTELIADKDTTIRDLRKLLFPLVTEKTREVLERAGLSDQSKPAAEEKKKPKKPGHGRNGADAYSGATRVEVPHGQLSAGDHCPGCEKGRVYVQQGRSAGAGADRGAGAADGNRLRTGASALQRLRTGLHRAEAGRRG